MPDRTPPTDTASDWINRHFFNSWWNAALTLGCLYLIYSSLPPFMDWAVFSAVWSGSSGADCRTAGSGACWPFIWAKWHQLFYGTYPADQLWRVHATYLLGAIGVLWLAIPRIGAKRWAVVYVFAAFPPAGLTLLAGGVFSLQAVETSEWGGLLLTIVVASAGMALSLPLGIMLALGRRSTMPVVRWLSIAFIEFWRGVPLVTVLFIASVLLPLVLNPGVSVDKLLRAMVCFSIFASAYMAEVVRGGLQSIDDGQSDAARALGLSYWRTLRLVVLPQALTRVIPGIVNTFIGLFKDTTLVLVIGLSDLLNTVQNTARDAKWLAPDTLMTGYVFAALVFWGVCYAMSAYSKYMERHLSSDT